MERGLHFGNVSISLVLLLPLLLPGLFVGPGSSVGQVQGSGSGSGSGRGEPPLSFGRLSALASEGDGARRGGMKQGSEDVDAPPVIGADVTVEDDDNNSNGNGDGSPGEPDDSYGKRNGNVAAPSR